MNFTLGRSIHLTVPRHFIIIVHDLIVMTLAFPLAILLRSDFHLATWHVEPLTYGTPIILLVSVTVFVLLGLHREMWSYASPKDLVAAVKAVTIVVVAFICLMFLFGRLDGVQRGALPILWFLAIAGVCGSRILYSNYKTRAYPSGQADTQPNAKTRLLIVGDGDAAALIAYLLAYERLKDAEIVGLVGIGEASGRTMGGVPVLGGIERFDFILAWLEARGLKPHRVIIASPHSELGRARAEALVKTAEEAGISVSDLPEIVSFRPGSALTSPKLPNQDTAVAAARMKTSATNVAVSFYHRLRRLFDGAVAGIVLAFMSPLMLVIMLVVLMTKGSPIWFDQCRPGRRMREFMLHKFRTMIDPMAPDGRLLSDDERVTAVGAFLRRSRLDELPQIWNVFVGDMALVGPRPLLPRDLPKVGHDMLQERFAVRPGITGWAQVNGGKKLTAEQKLALDLYYIRNASPLLDLKVIMMTVHMMLFGEQVNIAEINRAEMAIAAA